MQEMGRALAWERNLNEHSETGISGPGLQESDKAAFELRRYVNLEQRRRHRYPMVVIKGWISSAIAYLCHGLG